MAKNCNVKEIEQSKSLIFIYDISSIGLIHRTSNIDRQKRAEGLSQNDNSFNTGSNPKPKSNVRKYNLRKKET